MPSNFFTNEEGNSLLRKFEGVLANMQSIQHFDALVGYFRAPGYFKVRPFLENIQKIRILVGIVGLNHHQIHIALVRVP